jgi:hypothetical protein
MEVVHHTPEVPVSRKLFVAALLLFGCSAALSAADVAPPPRPVEPKAGPTTGKPSKVDPEKLKKLAERIKNADPARLKGVIDAEKLKELKEKIDKGDIDVEKLKELKKKLKKDKDGGVAKARASFPIRAVLARSAAPRIPAAS